MRASLLASAIASTLSLRPWLAGDRMHFDQLRRRDFITLLGVLGGAAAWPLGVSAQQPAKLPIIGYLGPSTRSVDVHRLGALVQRLRELGWIEGRTIVIEYR